MPLLYSALKRLAAYQLQRERGNHTLQATALVHELYLRLAAQRDAHWTNKNQFMHVAAQLMRRILWTTAGAIIRRSEAACRDTRKATVVVSRCVSPARSTRRTDLRSTEFMDSVIIPRRRGQHEVGHLLPQLHADQVRVKATVWMRDARERVDSTVSSDCD